MPSASAPSTRFPASGRPANAALLNRFGTVKAIGRAALGDLMEQDGISKAMAETVKFHSISAKAQTDCCHWFHQDT